MKNLETKKKFVELRALGHSFDNISSEINVSKPTLIEWSKKFGKDISELETTMMQDLHLQYKISKEARKQILGCQILAIIDELRSRDLKGVRTEKLMDMLVKTTSILDRIEEQGKREETGIDRIYRELVEEVV